MASDVKLFNKIRTASLLHCNFKFNTRLVSKWPRGKCNIFRGNKMKSNQKSLFCEPLKKINLEIRFIPNVTVSSAFIILMNLEKSHLLITGKRYASVYAGIDVFSFHSDKMWSYIP